MPKMYRKSSTLLAAATTLLGLAALAAPAHASSIDFLTLQGDPDASATYTPHELQYSTSTGLATDEGAKGTATVDDPRGGPPPLFGLNSPGLLGIIEGGLPGVVTTSPPGVTDTNLSLGSDNIPYNILSDLTLSLSGLTPQSLASSPGPNFTQTLAAGDFQITHAALDKPLLTGHIAAGSLVTSDSQGITITGNVTYDATTLLGASLKDASLGNLGTFSFHILNNSNFSPIGSGNLITGFAGDATGTFSVNPDAVAVPSPAAAGAGFTLLSLLAASRLKRHRLA